jgi:Phosphoadenosine phosphosulfate reductase family
VILDMVSRIDPGVRVVTVDSGRLHSETYELIDRFRDRYRLDIGVRMPDAGELEDFVRSEGVNPFYRSVALRMRWCEIRKVDPMRRALKGAEAWVAGLRHEQSESRAGVGKVEIDGLHGDIFEVSRWRTGATRMSGVTSARTTSHTILSAILAIRASVAPRVAAPASRGNTDEQAVGGGRTTQPRSAVFTPLGWMSRRTNPLPLSGPRE